MTGNVEQQRKGALNLLGPTNHTGVATKVNPT